MAFGNTMDFLYQKCSQRISNRVAKLGLSQSEIFPSDPKLISRIINNKRTEKNRYLVPDAVLGYVGGTFGFIPCLRFRNEQEVLWGDIEEIRGYLPQLYSKIVLDILDCQEECDSSKESSGYPPMKLILSDYVPYAKYQTYWDILFSSGNKAPAMFYGIREDTVVEQIGPAREKAIQYLYQKCNREFLAAFKQFVSIKTSFKKLDKVFYRDFIEKYAFPLFHKFVPDEKSLGLRVRNLILADLSQVPSLIIRQDENEKYHKALINASNNYILILEGIQLEFLEEALSDK